MHGPGLPPQQGPQPSSGGVVALRVLFTLLSVMSCGFLAWATMLRLAIVTRKPRDWKLLVATGVAEVVWLALTAVDPTPDNTGWQGTSGALGTIGTGVAVGVYFLVADIRHGEAARPAPPAHWYPAQPAPYAPPPQDQQTRPSFGYPNAPQVPQQAPAPAPPTPPRIGQVRAELDELSELLRKQPPPTPPHHEGPHHEDTGR